MFTKKIAYFEDDQVRPEVASYLGRRCEIW